MSSPAACDPCLRRALLLELLAPYIERVATRQPGSRSPELLRLGDQDLMHAVAPAKVAELTESAEALEAATLRNRISHSGSWACCRHDDAYPDWLRDSPEAPAALMARGDPRLLRELDHAAAVTIVGSRRASRYGSDMARDLGRDLASAGLSVISGMAHGIDSAAHEGAVEAGGATIAVLGCGPDVAYPPGRRGLHRQIIETGLVLSEMPPGSSAFKWTFPARNRIMAALAHMTVVVEAAERSGSLITAEMAADLGRLVGAVPGQANAWLSAGTNRLLHEGAHVIRNGQDVLDVMLGAGSVTVVRHGPPLDDELAVLLALVGQEPAGSDALAVATAAPAGKIAADLSRLEHLGYLRADALGRYSRTLLEPKQPARAPTLEG